MSDCEELKRRVDQVLEELDWCRDISDAYDPALNQAKRTLRVLEGSPEGDSMIAGYAGCAEWLA